MSFTPQFETRPQGTKIPIWGFLFSALARKNDFRSFTSETSL